MHYIEQYVVSDIELVSFFNTINEVYTNYFMPLIGIVTVSSCWLSVRKVFKIIRKIFAALGCSSIEIYIFHLYFFKIIRTSNKTLDLLIAVVLSIAGSYLTGMMIRRIPVISKLILGK